MFRPWLKPSSGMRELLVWPKPPIDRAWSLSPQLSVRLQLPGNGIVVAPGACALTISLDGITSLDFRTTVGETSFEFE